MFLNTFKRSLHFLMSDWKILAFLSALSWVLNYLLGQTIGAGQQSAGFILFALLASFVQVYLNVLIILKSEDHFSNKNRDLQELLRESVWASISFILYALCLLILMLIAGAFFGSIFYWVISKFVSAEGQNYLLPFLSSIPTTFVIAFILTPLFYLPWVAVIEGKSEKSYFKTAKEAIKGHRIQFTLLFWGLILFLMLGNFLEFLSMGSMGRTGGLLELLSALLIPLGFFWNYFFVGLYFEKLGHQDQTVFG